MFIKKNPAAWVIAATGAALLMGLSHQSNASDQLLETYVARLSADDHFNSNGQRLTSVAAIIRQDRANFHKFGVHDPDDEYDRIFNTQAKRDTLEQRLARGYCDTATRRNILNGTPLIYVKVYRHSLDVTVLD